MIAAIATVHVVQGKEDDFERVVAELARQVAANEPDCALYRFARDREDASVYRSLEIFRDQAAIDFHISQPYFHEAVAGMRACQGTRPSSVVFMDTIE